MRKITHITSAIILALLAIFVVAIPVKAEEISQEQEQSLNQELEIECTTSTYGQSTCKASGKQEAEQKQSQKIVLGTTNLYHKTVDAGMNNTTMAASLGMIFTGAGAAVIKIKQLIK